MFKSSNKTALHLVIITLDTLYSSNTTIYLNVLCKQFIVKRFLGGENIVGICRTQATCNLGLIGINFIIINADCFELEGSI